MDTTIGDNLNLFTGYIVYAQDKSIFKPYAVISADYKRQSTKVKVPLKMKNNIIQIEDRRFYNHYGIDLHSIIRATIHNLQKGRVVEGGSTLTQQLSRNLLDDFSKTLRRKINESILSIRLEKQYTKEEILDKFFDNVCWGNNVYGIRAASITYFSKEPHQLSEQEQLLLLTILRGPNYYLNNKDKLFLRYRMLNLLLLNRQTINKKHYIRNEMNLPKINQVNLSVLNVATIPYISSRIDEKRHIIQSSIDIPIQYELDLFVRNSPYYVSSVILSKGKFIAISSTYGSQHSVLQKANVGSTLKPFLYTFLRENGIDRTDLFNAHTNNLFWDVKEANYSPKTKINLEEALLLSNNNAFINASDTIGIDKTLSFLAKLLEIDRSQVFPSTILGATSSGISLADLAKIYYNYFSAHNTGDSFDELVRILNYNAVSRFGVSFPQDVFLKTGTTNNSSESYVILGNKEMVWAIVRGDKQIVESEKGLSLITQIKKTSLIKKIFINKTYRW